VFGGHGVRDGVTDGMAMANSDPRHRRMMVAALWFATGAATAVAASFPLAALCALAFRFPIPFDGYRSGSAAIRPALLAVVFYGVLGGFVVQAGVGGVAGLFAEHYGASRPRRTFGLCLALATMGASAGVVLLAVLDFIIGPW
jgi:hypothetical protein